MWGPSAPTGFGFCAEASWLLGTQIAVLTTMYQLQSVQAEAGFQQGLLLQAAGQLQAAVEDLHEANAELSVAQEAPAALSP